MAQTFNYQEYLASRNWALLKNQIRERSGGTCERCHQAPHQSTHHLTYERIGRELLDDLLGVCTPCHEYLSGKRDKDPAEPIAEPPKLIDADVGMYIRVPQGEDASAMVRLLDAAVELLRSHFEFGEWPVFFVLPVNGKHMFMRAIDFNVHACGCLLLELSTLVGKDNVRLASSEKGFTRNDQKWAVGVTTHKVDHPSSSN